MPTRRSTLPSRAPAFVTPPHDEGRRLVDVVRDRLVVVAAREVGPLVGTGAVLVDGVAGRIADPTPPRARLTVDDAALAALRDRDRLTVPHHDQRVVVLHEDDDVVVVDKPHGMHVHPMGQHRDATLVGALLWHVGARPDQPWGSWRPLPLHRLDRATSGLVVFATGREAQRGLAAALAAGDVTREYRAEVHGLVEDDEGTIDVPLGRDPVLDYRRAEVAVDEGGQAARTHYRVLERRHTTTVLRLTLDTGRTHQVRAHLAAIGHHVVGDDLYAASARSRSDATSWIELRAVAVSFPHPRSGRRIDVRADDHGMR